MCSVLGTQANVLSHINLKVAPGGICGLVDVGGGQNRTLCSLIPVLRGDGGADYPDGIGPPGDQVEVLRKKIGLVQQDVLAPFAGSVLENIKYGKPDATEEEVVEAAKSQRP